MSIALPIGPATRIAGPYVASAGQTAFSFSFPLLDPGDLLVATAPADAPYNWSPATLGTDYTVPGAMPLSAGGTVVFTTGRAAGTRVRITGTAVIANTTDATPAGYYDANRLNRFFDRNTIWAQEARRDLTEAQGLIDDARERLDVIETVVTDGALADETVTESSLAGSARLYIMGLASSGATPEAIAAAAAAVGARNEVLPARNETLQARDEAVSANLNRLRKVSSRAALKALDTGAETFAYLAEAGRDGIFGFLSGNYAALIVNDPMEGVYLKADAVAASAGAWVRMTDGYLRPRFFGAQTANSAFNSGSAINAMFDLLRYDNSLDGALYPAQTGGPKWNIDFQGTWYTTESIDATGIVPQLGRATIIGGHVFAKCTGKVVMDFTGTERMTWQGGHVTGDRINMPDVGIQLARAAGGFAGGMSLINCHTLGWFNKTGLMSYGAESGNQSGCFFYNFNPDGYAAVYQGIDGVVVASEHQTIETGAVSYIHNLYENNTYGYIPVGSQWPITGITNANPAVVTCDTSGLSVGDLIVITGVGGMTQANDKVFQVAAKTSTTIQLSGADATSWGAYTSGGYVIRKQTKASLYISRAYGTDFKKCYTVSYGAPSVKIDFPAGIIVDTVANLSLDILVEGAAIPSHIEFAPGTTNRTFFGFRYKTYQSHARDALFTTTGTGNISFFDFEIEVANHTINSNLPLVQSPAYFFWFGGKLAYPNPDGVNDTISGTTITSGNGAYALRPTSIHVTGGGMFRLDGATSPSAGSLAGYRDVIIDGNPMKMPFYNP